MNRWSGVALLGLSLGLLGCGGGSATTPAGTPDGETTADANDTGADSIASDAAGAGDVPALADGEAADEGAIVDGAVSDGEGPDISIEDVSPTDLGGGGEADTAGGCTSNKDCDDGDSCTQDQCDGGSCTHSAIVPCSANAPCEVSEGPGSSDAGITDCVCAMDDYCCTTAWDEYCVQLAGDACGATCACEAKATAELVCESSKDCEPCNDGDLCNGTWSCVEGHCQVSDPVVCDPALTVGCQKNTCNSYTGECVVVADFGFCDDGDVCTADACSPNGSCTHTKADGCGDNHPCQTATTPASKDPEITACVCASDSFCCSSSWDDLCVQQAQESCGAVCECGAAGEEALACQSDSDCSWCDEPGDLCAGFWTCEAGVCTAQGAVICDDSQDVGCQVAACNPISGICGVVLSVEACDDEDSCTADVCDMVTGDCFNEPIGECGLNSPCQVAKTPGSDSPEVDSCVCAKEPACCTGNWSNYCVFLAVQCGTNCDCSTWTVEQLACEVDADCVQCDEDGDRCNGSWVCLDGECAATPAVVCDTSGDVGCVETQCQWETGLCEPQTVGGACEDGDPCTDDQCDVETAECVHEALPACEQTHPCLVSNFPGTTDADIEACVCAGDIFCCETEWDPLCVNEAQDCGAVCHCASAPADDLACETDSDCLYCDADLNPCNGSWTCEAGTCVASAAVVCAPVTDGCLVNTCVVSLGTCEMVPVEGLCDDGSACTQDVCDPESGECDWIWPDGDCGITEPCVTAASPGSNDPAINACVCDSKPSCCTEIWGADCVELAVLGCGYSCGCALNAPDCTEDTDCAGCGSAKSPLCEGGWICNGGTCEATEPVVCEPDGAAGCLVPTCVPESGDCDYVAKAGACDDHNACTIDTCLEDGGCSYEAVPDCPPGGGNGPIPPPEPFVP